MANAVRIPISLREGNAYARTLVWTDDFGSSLWSAGASYATNGVVRAFPDVIDGFGNRKFFRVTTTGTSGGSQPALSSLDIGQTLVDNTVTWKCQEDSTFPVDLSTNGTIAELIVRGAPDDTASPVLSLSSPSGGIVLCASAVNSIDVAITKTQIAALIAALRYGYYDLRVTFPNGTSQTIFYGPITLIRSAVRT